MNGPAYDVNYNYTDVTEFYYENTPQTTGMGNYVSTTEPMPHLQSFAQWYRPIHGYLAAIVCVFGVIANVLNIIVLTRKNMISSTNIILTGLAITDGITMAMYLPYALQMYVIYGTSASSARDTKGCAKFLLSYAIVSVTAHSISIWFTVTLAVFRYVFIGFPRVGAKFCNVNSAKQAVVIVSIVVTIVCLPNSISYELKSGLEADITQRNTSTNTTIWWIDVKDGTEAKFLQNFNFWIQAVLVKLLPCLLLTVFSILLVKTMQDAERRRKNMMRNNLTAASEDGETQPIGSGGRRARRSQRTTRMLLTVVILFLVTETPQGVMSLLSGLIKDFFHNVYMPLGDVIDICALINNGINFVLYCTMSKQFRDTFITIFCHCFPKFNDGKRLKTVTMISTRDSEV